MGKFGNTILKITLLVFVVLMLGSIAPIVVHAASNGTLILKKHVINNNGGVLAANSFTLHVKLAGVDVVGSPAVGSEAGTTYILPIGTYMVSENGPTAGYNQLAGFGTDCDATGVVTITLNTTKNCMITNDDVAPSLTLNKVVINDNGGTTTESAWTIFASGPTSLSGPGGSTGSDVVSGSTFSAGTYTLSESPTAASLGYTASLWTCTNGITVTSGQIVLTVGKTTVCSITNNDIAAHIITTVHLINNNNNGFNLTAANFTVTISGGATAVGGNTFTGAEAPGTDKTMSTLGVFFAGTVEPTGYQVTYSAECSGTITSGQTKNCLITANDRPKLTVIKIVTNHFQSKGVGDFPLYVIDIATLGVTLTTSSAPMYLTVGDFAISEVSDPTYRATWTGNCDSGGYITLGVTDSPKTCTITNEDESPPYVSNFSFTEADYVPDSPGAGLVTFSWQYNQANGAHETAFEIQIANASDPNFQNLPFVVDRHFGGLDNCNGSNCNNTFNNQAVSIYLTTIADSIKYNNVGGSYNVRVRVQATGQLSPPLPVWSNWFTSAYQKSGHPSAYPSFTFYPANPIALENIAFTNHSTCYTTVVVPCQSYRWDFGDTSAYDFTTNPVHEYTALHLGSNVVTLRATDNVGPQDTTKTINVGSNALNNIPIWKEVVP